MPRQPLTSTVGAGAPWLDPSPPVDELRAPVRGLA